MSSSVVACPSRTPSDPGHDLARRTIAALEGVLVDECLLHRMQLAARCRQTFDGIDLAYLHRRGQGQARQHTLAVDVHGTGAALALIANLFSSR